MAGVAEKKIDLTSPNEKVRRSKIVETNRQNLTSIARKAQVNSLVNAKRKAEKRKENTAKRAEKRQRTDGAAEDEPDAKKKKSSGRVIPFSDRDFEHVKRLFHTAIVFFGNVNLLGLYAAYDCMACPVLIYPIFTAQFDKKKQSVLKRKFILGVGKSSSVFTGIQQAFSELYPEYPVSRVYDWELMKWNKKAYKAATVNVAVDPGVLTQHIFSSKSFGGTKHLPAVKIIDELGSARKMECAIEVSKYFSRFIDEKIRHDMSPEGNILSFEDVNEAYKEAERKRLEEKQAEDQVAANVANSNLIKEAFDKMLENTNSESSEEDESSSDE